MVALSFLYYLLKKKKKNVSFPNLVSSNLPFKIHSQRKFLLTFEKPTKRGRFVGNFTFSNFSSQINFSQGIFFFQ